MENIIDGLNLKSKILLIEPPFYRFFGYERWHYPVTLTLVATYFEKLGHYVRVYDADKPTADCKPLKRHEVINNYPKYETALSDVNHPIWREVSEVIKEYQPDMIGLTSITAKIDSANIIAKMAKDILSSKVKIVLGGAHAQGVRIIKPNYDFGPYYDQIVLQIPGLIRLEPNKNLILGHKTYSAKNFSSILTSSGCPNVCTFCCHSYEKTITYRDIENIRNEVKDIKEQFNGSEPIYIMDDCLFSNTKHFDKVTNLLSEYEFSFIAGSRVMALSQEKINQFISRGGIKILVGVESGSQKVLDRIKKRLKIEEIIKRTRWLNDAGITWSAFIIVGFPFETIDDLKLTEELIYNIRPSFVSINRFTPYPGTELYKEFFFEKHIEFKNFFQLNRSNCVDLSNDIQIFIEKMFVSFDEYNQQNRLQNI